MKLIWSLRNFWAYYSLRFVLFVMLVTKFVSKVSGKGKESLNKKTSPWKPLLTQITSFRLSKKNISVAISRLLKGSDDFIMICKVILYSLQNILPITLFSCVKEFKIHSLFYSSLQEINTWIFHEIDLLHTISCCDRGNTSWQTIFEHVSAQKIFLLCFACLLYFLYHSCCQNRIFFVPLSRLLGK